VKYIEKSPFLAVVCQVVGIPVNWSSDKQGLTAYGLWKQNALQAMSFHQEILWTCLVVTA